MTRYLRQYILLMLSILAISVLGAGSVKITVETPGAGNKVGLGETFYIVISAQDCPGDLDLEAHPGGSKVVYNSSSRSVSMTSDGSGTHRKSTTTLTLTCKAVAAGKYSFGPVKVGGVASNSISYEVTSAPQGGQVAPGKSSQGAPSSASPDDSDEPKFIGQGNDEIFLRASVNKTNVWEQEALVYTVKLYTTYEPIKFLGAAAAPKFEGFVIEESKDVSTSLSFESYNGKNYATAIIARYIIFPQKAGKLKILGNTYTVSTDARQYYHDPFYQTLTVRRPIQLNVTPNDLVIDVKALPTPQPADFSGAVGNFSIASKLPTQKFLTNAAASIQYTVTGTGNIKYLKLQDLNALYPQALEVFTPEAKTDVNVGSANVSGTAKFDYSFVPQETGSFEIPEVKLVYFNPNTGKYETSIAKGYHIEVGLGESSAKSQKAAKFDSSLSPVGKLVKMPGSPMITGFLYWLWYIIPALGLVIALVSYQRYLRLHNDVTGLKSKRASKMAMRRLKKAKECMQSGNKEQFYDEMLSALWGYLAHKLKMPTSDLTRPNVLEVLNAHGVDSQKAEPIVKLIDECEFEKYAPASSPTSMEDIYKQGVEVIDNLESDFRAASRQSVAKQTSEDEI